MDIVWYCVENNTVLSTMEFSTSCGFSFQMGSLMRANVDGNDLNMLGTRIACMVVVCSSKY